MLPPASCRDEKPALAALETRRQRTAPDGKQNTNPPILLITVQAGLRGPVRKEPGQVVNNGRLRALSLLLISVQMR